MTTSSGDIHPLRPLRILIVRLGSMGDIIHAMPAVTVLRRMLPTAVIGWVIEDRWKELLCAGAPLCMPETVTGKPLVNVVHEVNTLGWRKSLLSGATWREITNALRRARSVEYDIVVDFQGACKSAAIAKLSGAPVRVGFRGPRETTATLFYNRQHIATEKHVIEQNVAMAWAVVYANRGTAVHNGWLPRNTLRLRTLPVQEHHPERRRPTDTPRVPFPRDPHTDEWCELELSRHRLPVGEYAIINPGAGWGAKCWPVERYAQVAAGLAKKGLRSIVNFGPNEENLAMRMEELSGGAAIPVGCSISQLIALTRRARLFIGGDTGPLHLAAALGVPVVAVFGPTDPARNGPYGTANIVLRSPESRTSHARAANVEEGLLSITAADVLNAVRQLIPTLSAPAVDDLTPEPSQQRSPVAQDNRARDIQPSPKEDEAAEMRRVGQAVEGRIQTSGGSAV
jgi:heptosyltransferase I